MWNGIEDSVLAHVQAPGTDGRGYVLQGSDPRLQALADARPLAEAAIGGPAMAAVARALSLDSTPHNSHTRTHPYTDCPDFGDSLEGDWYGKLSSLGHRAELLLVEDADHSLRRGSKKGRKPEPITDDLLDSPVGLEECLSEWNQTGITQSERNLISVQRAKKTCTWKIIAINADRMLTLTQRGRIPTRTDACWLAAEFVRKVKRVYPEFVCVYVIEPHKEDGFHIHMALNRFYFADRLRLMWHRTLTGLPLRAILRGEDAPGGIDFSKVLRSAKLVRYMTKYITKTFADPIAKGSRRFFASEKIGGPNVKKFRMPKGMGAEVLWARNMLESRGYLVVRRYETVIAGRRAIWLQGELRSGINPVDVTQVT
jgi:hypothetical protein